MTSTGSSGSSGGPVTLTPLNLFLVSITLPDVPATDPNPPPAASTFQGLNLADGTGLNMQQFPEE